MVLVLVVGIISWQMPLVMALDHADRQRDDAGLLVGILEIGIVEV